MRSKRLLAMLLTLTMVVSGVPSAAIAAETEAPEQVEEQQYNDVEAQDSVEDGEAADITEVPAETQEEETVPAETASEEEVPAEAEASETEEAPAQAEEAEAMTFEGRANGVNVYVEAPAGAFEAGTVMTVKKASAQDVIDAINDTEDVNIEVKSVKAVDITFTDANGEAQPKLPINVKLTSDLVAETEAPIVVHVDDDGVAEEMTEVQAVEGEDDAIEFEAEHFSVYAIVETGETGDNARLLVKFIQADGTVVNIYVKKSDIKTEYIDGVEVNHFEQVLYDPGVGNIDSGKMFLGWTKKQNYNVNDEHKTIEGVRNEVKNLLEAEPGVKEGDSITYYPMILNARYVSYLDELGASIKNDLILFKDGDTAEYTVNQQYTPREQDSRFEGWAVASYDDNEQKYIATDTVYQNNATITFDVSSSSIVLIAKVPAGHWLIFNEVAKGASYTAPQFVLSEATTKKPEAPTRAGYDFAGWFEGSMDSDGNVTYGSEFTAWGQKLETSKTLFAKWTAKANAEYTVIIWKQQIEGNKYDFGLSFRLTGSTSEAINPVTKQTNNNTDVRDDYARIDDHNFRNTGTYNGKDYDLVGFHLGNYSQNVTVTPEGTTVVNVYYDRNEYTFTFRDNYTTIHTVKRRYQADIVDIWTFTGSNNISYPRNGYYNGKYYVTSWQPSGSATYTARITKMAIMPAEDITFTHQFTSNTTRTFYYYVEALDNASDNVEPITYGGKTYTQYDKLENDFNIVFYNDDFWLLDGFSRLNITDSNLSSVSISTNGNRWPDVQNNNYRPIVLSSGATANTLYFFYSRDKFKITYFDGRYYNGANPEVEIKENNRGLLHTGEDIYYGASLSDHENDYTPVAPNGYVFAGWYLDDACQEPFDFAASNMPKGGIKLYAKWKQIQYRVFLHPNVTESEDPNFSMGGQSTSFRLDYGDKIAQLIGIRDEYEQVGWYTDPGFTTAWNFDAYVGNDTNITTTYAKTENTELTTPYGTVEPGKEGINSDLTGYNGGDRFWITRKLDLYLKWRLKLTGAQGIQVVYDAVDGTGVGTGHFADSTTKFNDPVGYYTDSADVIGQGASIANSEKQEFKYWVLQKWDGEKYVDTETHVYPGGEFTIHKADAREEVIDGAVPGVDPYWLTYTVQLRAEYGSIEAPTPTHINWYSNIQDIVGNELEQAKFVKSVDVDTWETDKGWKKEVEPVVINQGYKIENHDLYSYPGYTFLGWAKKSNATENDLFLRWVEATETADGYYEAKNSSGTWVKVTQVAADENQPYDDLYAVWQGSFYVYHSGVAGGNRETIQMNKTTMPNGTYDLTQKLTENTLYGGYYLKNGFTAPAEVEEKIPAYDGDNWTWTTAQTTSGKAIKPVVGETYYIKEVPAHKFLQSYTHYTYRKVLNTITNLFMVSDIDDNQYLETGFVITEATKAKVCKSLTVTNAVGGASVKLTPQKVFKAKDATSNDYLTYLDVTKLISDGSAITQYWITPDNLIVTGTAKRVLTGISSKTTLGKTDSEEASTITENPVNPQP